MYTYTKPSVGQSLSNCTQLAIHWMEFLFGGKMFGHRFAVWQHLQARKLDLKFSKNPDDGEMELLLQPSMDGLVPIHLHPAH